MNQASISDSSARIWRPTSALSFAASRLDFINLPCVILDAVRHARPSAVLGPVEAPPWSRQRPTGSLAGRWQGVPLRVRAAHLWPGQLGPKRQSMPISTLPFVIIKNIPIIGFYSSTKWSGFKGFAMQVK